MTSQQQQPTGSSGMVQHMAVVNRLCLKAFNSKTLQTLIFTILNDTVHVSRYDRAVLWDLEGRTPKMLGISGQAKINKDASLTKQWIAMTGGIIDRSLPQIVTAESLKSGREEWHAYQEQTNATVLWLPIFAEKELVLGMWIELFEHSGDTESLNESLKFLMNFLTPSYGAAWKKLSPSFNLRKLGMGRQHTWIAAAGIFLFLLFVKVPLRVVAPCEVAAQDPMLITAPMDGIIAEVVVEPGQKINRGEVILEYDKQVPIRNLKVAEKEVEILEAEANRARTMGLTDQESRTQLGILLLKLDKQKINLNLQRWYASLLSLRSPVSGVVIINNPDAWTGKPVRTGERIMSISDPAKTKIKIWIPEEDNVILDPKQDLKIYLNVNPESSYSARLTYIANESFVSEDMPPSFIAEAEWVDHPKNIKLGLKGTAILYGERVSLLYFILRKPWAFFRRSVGF